MNNKIIVDKAKNHFLESFKTKQNPIYPYLPKHVVEVEKWANKILQKYPEVNQEIVLLAVWLHDIGQNVGDCNKKDHAIESEVETRRFLAELGISFEEIEKVAHCVRAHRCKDIQPETLEAKIVAVADSASHMTDFCYIDMASKMSKYSALEKLERDYRDVGLFPELKKAITPLYKAWKKLLNVYIA